MRDTYTFRCPETGRLVSFAEVDEFEYVGIAERADGHQIHLHRHPHTGDWRNLDAQGRLYQFAGADPDDPREGWFVRTIAASGNTATADGVEPGTL
ncbi:MAG: hypothetical protein HOH36_16850 [Acidimicrobiaceae bacterium]|jgi:hypothetical protein|nr:hypothetical protein [Acidimicrobiaceae bacterium]MBT5852099.1 hypothetical protein [Acidimicrobiaceae bacterium]